MSKDHQRDCVASPSVAQATEEQAIKLYQSLKKVVMDGSDCPDCQVSVLLALAGDILFNLTSASGREWKAAFADASVVLFNRMAQKEVTKKYELEQAQIESRSATKQ